MISRRSFLSLSGAGGLMVVVGVGCKGKEEPSAQVTPSQKVGTSPKSSVNTVSRPPVASTNGGRVSAWLHIAENDVITYFVPEAEMGQGIHTAVALVVGAELGGAWKYATATTAPVDAVAFGWQSTGGSTSMRKGFEAIRLAGATARELLIVAGAKKLGVEPKECEAVDSYVRWTKGDKAVRFGEIAEAAATLPAQPAPQLRTKLDVGKPVPRLDSFEKATGSAVFGIDVQVPGMVIGKSAHAPSLGGVARKVDDAGAKNMSGVRAVVKTSAGVVVLADHTWAAMKGRDALKITWSEPNANLSTESIAVAMAAAIPQGVVAFESGDVKKAFAKTQTVIEAEYSVPYLAHAPMEPLSCTVQIKDGRCDIWTGTQSPSGAANRAAKITGIASENIVVHSQFLGGGFGRRSKDDFVAEAVEAAHSSGKTVKLIWDREDDIRGYQYRPAALHRFRAAVDREHGTLVGWEHQIASPSILKQFSPLGDGIDNTSIDGVVKYGVADMRITYSDVDLPVPVWFWRSVGHSQNCFAVDAFMNEAAKAAGRDPLEFRLGTTIVKKSGGISEESPRLRHVLEVVAEKSNWGSTLPDGVARGIAISESFGSFVAQVAEVSIESNGRPRVHRVHTVIDCGLQINPRTIEAQMDSSVAFGLSAALFGDIHFEKGRVLQGNFDTFPVIRFHEMPTVETTIIPSDLAPGGVGEPAVPPVAAAVAGALFALDGMPRRTLPIVKVA